MIKEIVCMLLLFSILPEVSGIVITINNPINDTINMNNLNVTFNETANAASYSLDDGSNVSIGSISNYSGTLSNLEEGSHKITVYANDSNGDVNLSTVQWVTSFKPKIIQSSRVSGYSFYRPIYFLPNMNVNDTFRQNLTFTWYKNGVPYKNGMVYYIDEFGDTLNSSMWKLNSGSEDVWSTSVFGNSFSLYKKITLSQLNLSVPSFPNNYVLQMKIRFGNWSQGSASGNFYMSSIGNKGYTLFFRRDNSDIIFLINGTSINCNTYQIQPFNAHAGSCNGEYVWSYNNNFINDGTTWIRFIVNSGQHNLYISRDGSNWIPVIDYYDISTNITGGTFKMSINNIETWIDEFIVSPDLNFTLTNSDIDIGDIIYVKVGDKISDNVSFTNPFLIEHFSNTNEITKYIELIPYNDQIYSNLTIKLIDVVSLYNNFSIKIDVGNTRDINYIVQLPNNGSVGNITIPLFELTENQLGIIPRYLISLSIYNNTNYSSIEFWRSGNNSINRDNKDFINWIRSFYKFMKNGYLNHTLISNTHGYIDMNPQMNLHSSRGFVGKNEIGYYLDMKLLNKTLNMNQELNLDFETTRQESVFGLNDLLSEKCITTYVGSDPEGYYAYHKLYDIEQNPYNCWYNKTVSVGESIFRNGYNITTGVMHTDKLGIGYLDWHDMMRPILVYSAGIASNNSTYVDSALHTYYTFFIDDRVFYNNKTGIYYTSVIFDGTNFTNQSGNNSPSGVMGVIINLLDIYNKTHNVTYLNRANYSIHQFVNYSEFQTIEPGRWVQYVGDEDIYFDYHTQILYGFWLYRVITGQTDLIDYERNTFKFITGDYNFIDPNYLNIGSGQYGNEYHMGWKKCSSSGCRSEYDYLDFGNYQSAESSKGIYILLDIYTKSKPFKYFIQDTFNKKASLNTSDEWMWIKHNISYDSIKLNQSVGSGRLYDINGVELSPEGIVEIEYSLSINTEKHITSNLSTSINSTVIFIVPNCDINSINYVSGTGIYDDTYTSGDWSCSGTTMELNLTGIEESGTNMVELYSCNTPSDGYNWKQDLSLYCTMSSQTINLGDGQVIFRDQGSLTLDNTTLQTKELQMTNGQSLILGENSMVAVG